MTHHLKLDQVEIWLHGRRVIALDIEIGPGEIVTLMGPSGIGKTSLLHHIAGFLGEPFETKGRVLIDGDNITDARPEDRKAGLIFQDPLLYPHMSVGGNLAFALPKHHHDRQTRIDAALAMVGLEGFADRDPATLSGGQRSRVALVRTLLAEPSVILMDEPFSKLDLALKDEIRKLTIDAIRSAKFPAILVTHDIADARAIGGSIIDLASTRP